MNKKQEVIQAIRKQLPRLMELKKGCLVKCSGFTGVHEVILNRNSFYMVDCFSNGVRVNLRKEDFDEIIGKEPTILDALECITKNYDEFHLNCDYINNQGRLYISMNNVFFDLSKPLIKDLSEEMINFLHSILCK